MPFVECPSRYLHTRYHKWCHLKFICCVEGHCDLIIGVSLSHVCKISALNIYRPFMYLFLDKKLENHREKNLRKLLDLASADRVSLCRHLCRRKVDSKWCRIVLVRILSKLIQSYIMAGTNFSWQDEPWAEFSTLEEAACHAKHLLCSIVIRSN